MTLDGKAALLGTMYITVCAPRNATCLNLARGAKVGSITVPAPALPTFARPGCYLPCQSLHTGAAQKGTVVAPLSTPMATTTQHALEPDCSPAEQSPSSMHG